MKFSSFVLSAALIVQQTNAKCYTYERTYDGSKSGKDIKTPPRPKKTMGYYSTNNVTAEAKIDLDVAEIGKLFDGETDGNWTLAKGIYEVGKNGVEENGGKLSIKSMSLALNDLDGKEIPKV